MFPETHEGEAPLSPFLDEALVFAEESGGFLSESFAGTPATVHSPFQTAFKADTVVDLEPKASVDEELETLEFEAELPEVETVEGSVLGGLFSAGEIDVGEDAFAEPPKEALVEDFAETWNEKDLEELLVEEEKAEGEELVESFVDDAEKIEAETFLDEFDEEDIDAQPAYEDGFADETHPLLGETQQEDFDDEFDLWIQEEAPIDDAQDVFVGEEVAPSPRVSLQQPLAVPPTDPLDFAPVPFIGSYWPIVTRHRLGREINFQATDNSFVGSFKGRRFLASRSKGKRYHLGVDLFADYGDPVVACESGRIVNFYGFCCGKNKTSWALFVEHPNVVINYGEVAPDSLQRTGLEKGSSVRTGQLIGYIGRNPGGSSMLHFETYVPGVRSNKQWKKGGRRPSIVLNPTKYLLFLQQFGLVGKNDAVSPVSAPLGGPGLDVPHTIHRNRHWRDRLGWNAHEGAIARLLGFTNMKPDERMFAEAVSYWQSDNGLEHDGIIGPKTWKRMRSTLGLVDTPTVSTAPTVNGDGPAGPFGTLTVDPLRFGLPAKFRFEYQFTLDDAVWLARFIKGESRGKGDENDHAVIWAMFNRFGLFNGRLGVQRSFAKFLRAYSTVLQPYLRNPGAARRTLRLNKENPRKYPVKLLGGSLDPPHDDIPRVQLARHVRIQNMRWNEFSSTLRSLVERAVNSGLPNPGIGIASEFANTMAFLKHTNRRPTRDDWRRFTERYARTSCKRSARGCTWIGERTNLEQVGQNAFFIDNRVKDFPAQVVTVARA